MEYKYLPADLPIRAWESLSRFYKEENEVSTLLCAAWAVFVVPTERLDLISTRPHPVGDVNSSDEGVRSIVNQWKEKKLEEINDLSAGEGLYLNLPDGVRSMSPDSTEWIEAVTLSPVNQTPKWGDFLSTLRHGLSHGNIWTERKSKCIEKLFIANYPLQERAEPRVLVVRPESLLVIIDGFVNWYKGCIEPGNAQESIGLSIVASK